MGPLIHCVYASTAAPQFKEHQVPMLLDKARVKNAGLGVTGMLLYVEGSFLQVIEGEPEAIEELYTTIGQDARHTRVTQIIREPIAQRNFAEWTMGFSAVGLDQAGELLGENDFFTDASCMERLNAGRAKKILLAFGSGRWRAENTGKFAAPFRRA